MLMTKEKFATLLEKWKPILGLSDWFILIVYGKCDNINSYMQVQRMTDYKRAKITIPPWLIGEGDIPAKILLKPHEVDENFWEQSLVHELLHIVVVPMSVIIKDDLDGYFHRDVYDQVEKAFDHAEERVVDDLAVALCKAFREKDK